MPKGPRVHEIFSSSNVHNKNEGSTMQNGHPVKKKGFAPLPPMTRFGGHKPKILGGMDELVPIEHSPPHPSPSIASPNKVTPKPILTKPKPFIVGDKDTPMVLSVVDDADDENNNIDSAMNDMGIHDTLEDIDTKDVDQSCYRYQSRIEKRDNELDFDPPELAAPQVGGSMEDFITKGNMLPSAEDFASENVAFTSAPEGDLSGGEDPTYEQSRPKQDNITSEKIRSERNEGEKGEEIDDVAIPDPDYDEKEEVLEFSEEDPYDLPEYIEFLQPKPISPAPKPVSPPVPQQVPQQNPPPIPQQDPTIVPQESPYFVPQQSPTLVSQAETQPINKRASKPSAILHPYAMGDDFGQYLSDDEDFFNNPNVPPPPNPGKARRGESKLNQKHLMFKQPARNSIPNLNSNNNSFSNSVRGFSYADSKFGTKSKIKTRAYMMGAAKNDGPQLADDTYESFLFSRHGHTMPSRSSAPNVLEFGQWNGANSRTKEDRVWKKWTVRLKNKFTNRNGYAMTDT